MASFVVAVRAIVQTPTITRVSVFNIISETPKYFTSWEGTATVYVKYYEINASPGWSVLASHHDWY